MLGKDKQTWTNNYCSSWKFVFVEIIRKVIIFLFSKFPSLAVMLCYLSRRLILLDDQLNWDTVGIILFQVPRLISWSWSTEQKRVNEASNESLNNFKNTDTNAEIFGGILFNFPCLAKYSARVTSCFEGNIPWTPEHCGHLQNVKVKLC